MDKEKNNELIAVLSQVAMRNQTAANERREAIRLMLHKGITADNRGELYGLRELVAYNAAAAGLADAVVEYLREGSKSLLMQHAIGRIDAKQDTQPGGAI